MNMEKIVYPLTLTLLAIVIIIGCGFLAQAPSLYTGLQQDSVLAKMVKLENKVMECLTEVKAQVHELQNHVSNIEELQRARHDQNLTTPPPDPQKCSCDSKVKNDSKPVTNILTSCKSLKADQPSGRYMMITMSNSTFEVYCEQKTLEGGWTVIQNRFNGSVDFYRGWTSYRDGFGDLNGEFWMGLDKIYKLTSSRKHLLYIEAEDFNGNRATSMFSKFSISSESDQYRLSVSGYSGYRGLDHHDGRKFSTYDRDNDGDSRNCADLAKSGWWHNCYEYMNLNGKYKNGRNSGDHNYSPLMTWWNFKGYNGLKSSKMMIREI